MSESLTFEELRTANTDRRWDIHRDAENPWGYNDWAVATAGELGEALNLLKKVRRGEKVLKQDIAHELADTVIYLDLLADSLGIDLGEAVREKFNVVSERYGVRVKL
jgi:NTP pyrophosphatase (non-canonical NTP hydrolase)